MKSKTFVPSPVVNTAIIEFLRNETSMRQQALARLLDPRRDLEKECGHPATIQISDYTYAFNRGDLANRIVTTYPVECWSDDPALYENDDEEETAFEKEWQALQKRVKLYSYLQRVDVLSGIGRFGVLLLGIDDALDLALPASGVSPSGEKVGSEKRKLLYVRAFDESLVTISELEGDVRNPRYGLPTQYQLQFADNVLGIAQTAGDSAGTTVTKKVHWSRIIHVADNRMSSDVFGIPRMQIVFNRLLDIQKISGGSAEMFWKGGFPGISLEVAPGVDVAQVHVTDEEKAKWQQELYDYMNGLQRYISVIGMTAKPLTPQIADPGPHIEQQIRLIAMAMGVPWRILMGVEVGQLASEQDMRAWNRRLARRRTQYLTPFLLEPLVDRLIAFGVLPEVEEYKVIWPDLNTPTDKDKAEVAKGLTEAIVKYVQAGADQLIDPFHFLTEIVNLDDEIVNAILEEVGDRLIETDPDAEAEHELELEAARAKGRQQVPPGGGRQTMPAGGNGNGRTQGPRSAGR